LARRTLRVDAAGLLLLLLLMMVLLLLMIMLSVRRRRQLAVVMKLARGRRHRERGQVLRQQRLVPAALAPVARYGHVQFVYRAELIHFRLVRVQVLDISANGSGV